MNTLYTTTRISAPETTGARRSRRSRNEIAMAHLGTREKLIWCGTELLTERGFHAIGIEEVLKIAGVAKGSFYHFFESKQAFLIAVIEKCREYYNKKYEEILLNPSRPPLDRVQDFAAQAIAGMEKFEFRRGCLVGNLGQELASMDNHIASLLNEIMQSWEDVLAQCLQEGVDCGDISKSVDVRRQAQFFFIGWQGAVLRSKLRKSSEPLSLFVDVFLAATQSEGAVSTEKKHELQ
ncbi:TetR/AcrR family transcriptional regulator [Candidimonas nitroreducens]|uniref:TetR family transcriptional regulator n=1 Tax=Candidimonas nitroreducens TaxID=683354 RepID=A0A225MRT1_9BURK|nr:TetR/AcrR family transcriptional regulator [Candidimonas nitroreducens]OWT63945.1 TetR family transcriptional regulator [Candidimonas nitroreducens]